MQQLTALVTTALMSLTPCSIQRVSYSCGQVLLPLKKDHQQLQAHSLIQTALEVAVCTQFILLCKQRNWLMEKHGFPKQLSPSTSLGSQKDFEEPHSLVHQLQVQLELDWLNN